MSDSANPVRQFKNHLREAGALIASRRYDEATRHVDAALALDPASLAALTLRERIHKARAGSTAGRVAAPRIPASSMPAADAPAANPPRFIPSGVNAASWLDFEQRIQERRFRALVDTAQRAIAAGNGVAARAAIEEARELHPDSGELSNLSGRAALLPVIPPGSHDRYARSRTMRAASMLLFGVTLLLGLDWIRSDTVADVTSASAFPDSLGPSIESLPGADVIAEPEILSRIPTVALPERPEDASELGEDKYVRGTAGEAIDQEAPAPPAVAIPPARPLNTRAAAAPVLGARGRTQRRAHQAHPPEQPLPRRDRRRHRQCNRQPHIHQRQARRGRSHA